MATCPVQPLLSLAECFGVLTPGQRQLVILQLLCQILGMSTCDVQALLDDANCFATLTPGQRDDSILVLLCNIWQGGGGGGSASITRGSGSPEGVITGGTGAGEYLGYIDTDDCSFYKFAGTAGTSTGWC